MANRARKVAEDCWRQAMGKWQDHDGYIKVIEEGILKYANHKEKLHEKIIRLVYLSAVLLLIGFVAGESCTKKEADQTAIHIAMYDYGTTEKDLRRFLEDYNESRQVHRPWMELLLEKGTENEYKYWKKYGTIAPPLQ